MKVSPAHSRTHRLFLVRNLEDLPIEDLLGNHLLQPRVLFFQSFQLLGGHLAKDVTGTSIWHINADEPRFLDYNEEFNPATLYNADDYRSCDHDPVLIGIQN
jgi:hypothetical protein